MVDRGWNWTLVLGLGCLFLFGAGCDGSEDDAPARLRVVHSAAATPTIDFFIDFDLFTRDLSFRQASPYIEWKAGLRTLEVRTTGSGGAVISTSREVLLEPDRSYTVLVTGTDNAALIALLEDDRSAPSAGQAHVRVAQGASRFGLVDVFVAPEGSNTPVLEAIGLAFGTATPQANVAPGRYDFVVANGAASEALRGQPVEAGRRYLVVLTNSAASPFFVVIDG